MDSGSDLLSHPRRACPKLPHPRINPNVKGSYVKLSGFVHPRDARMRNWVRVEDIQRAEPFVDASGRGMRVHFKPVLARPVFVYRGGGIDRAKAELAKRGIGD